jgi:hypothetical protein
VLNGATGIGEILAQVMGQGASGLKFARSVLSASASENAPRGPAANGAAPPAAPEAIAPPTDPK